MTYAIVQGDVRALPLPDASADLIITSPPYWRLRDYADGGSSLTAQIGQEPTPGGYVAALVDATREMMRVLSPQGSMFINLGDKYASTGPARKSLLGLPWRYAIACTDTLGLILRAEIIWDRPNSVPESCTDRVRRTHETWFHLTHSGTYCAGMDAIREPWRTTRTTPRTPADEPSSWGRQGRYGPGVSAAKNIGNPAGALPRSVQAIPSQPLTIPGHVGAEHHAAFPVEWPKWLIRGWCPPGGVVLDPFGGTGTTILAADVLGRHGIHVDLSRDYCEIAAWRVTDPGQRRIASGAKTTQVPGQLTLLTG